MERNTMLIVMLGKFLFQKELISKEINQKKNLETSFHKHLVSILESILQGACLQSIFIL